MVAKPPHPLLEPLLSRPEVRRIRRLAAGSPVHLVGGCVRDALLGVVSRDLDLVVGGGGEELARRVAAGLEARLVDLSSGRFPTFRLIGDGFELDLWDRRETTLEEELARRDLTINAIACDLESGAVSDPWGGLQDLRAKVLRPPRGGVFREDPLRVLRLARFAARLEGFGAAPDALEEARRASPGLVSIAPERIRDELDALFDLTAAGRGFSVLLRTTVYPELWCRSDPAPGATDLPAALDRVAGVLELVDRPGLPLLRPPLAREALAFAHLPAPRHRITEWRERRLLSKRRASELASVLTPDRLPATPLERRRFFFACGPLWPVAVVRLAAAGDALPETAINGLLTLWRTEGEQLVAPPALLSGEEVCRELGIEEGPEVGRVLRDLRELQVERRLTTRREALELLRRRRRAT